MPGTENTVAVLRALAVGGTAFGALLAFVLEYVPFVQEGLTALPFAWRRVVVFLFCFAVPLAAQAGRVYLGDTPNTPDAWLAALVAGGTVVVSSQIVHGIIRRPGA